MPVLNITVHERTYKVACGEGQEEHLEALARKLDERMADMSSQLGKGSESVLLLMTALTLEDALSEALAKVEKLQNGGVVQAPNVAEENQSVNVSVEAEKQANEKANEALANAIDGVADYIDNVINKLNKEEETA